MIYVISTVYIEYISTNPLGDCNISTRGYYLDIDYAYDVMKSSGWWFDEYAKDLKEGNSIYFVIEEIDEGLAPSLCKEMQWYRLELVGETVEPVRCLKPECLKQLVHFGMS